MIVYKNESRQPSDSGLSLIEIVVALALIGIIATAAATFFISGLATNKNLRTEQVAASVANQALDAARAVSPRPPASGEVSGLLKGRSQSDVESAFASVHPSDVSDLLTTDAWDPNGLNGTTDDWVPLKYETQVGKSTYRVTTLIGGCYRPRDASTGTQECTLSGTEETHVLIYRVRAVVSWNEKHCSDDDRCTYRATALIDPSADVYWNANLKPYPVDDDMEVSAGDTTPTETAVIGNDDIDLDALPPGFNPLTEIQAADPNHVKGTTAIAGIGVISYLPIDDDYSGTDAFTYKLRNGQYVSSDAAATVRVRILPRAIDDDFRISSDGESTLDLLDNDLGRVNGQGLDKKIIATTSPDLDVLSENPTPELDAQRSADADALAALGIRVEGTNLVVNPSPAGPEEIDVYYYLADYEDLGADGEILYPSRERAHVRILIGDCMNIDDHTIVLTADQVGNFNDLGVNDLNGNKASCRIELVSVDWNPVGQRGQIRIGSSDWPGGSGVGTTVSYRPQQDIPYYFQLTYRMIIGGSSTTETKVLTVKIKPIANDDVYDVPLGSSNPNNVFRPANSPQGSLRANDYPANGGQLRIELVNGLPSGCGSFTQGVSTSGGKQYLDNDGIVYRPPTTPKTCRITYRLVPTNSGLVNLNVDSDTARVTFKVGNPTIHNEISSIWSNYAQTPGIPNSAVERVENIADKTASTKWFVGLQHFSPRGQTPIQVIYSLDEAVTLTRYSITSANDANQRDPRAWRVYGSNTAGAAENPGHGSWEEIDIRSDETWNNRHQTREFTVTNPGQYQYYRLEIRQMRNSTDEFQISDWTLEN